MLDDLMSLDIDPISPLKMKYINELRERAKDLLASYPYAEHVVCDVNLLRFVRGHEVKVQNVVQYSSIWMRHMRRLRKCSVGERRIRLKNTLKK